MRGKIMLAVGLAAGYVLGTRAGRERYEQITRTARRATSNPQLQHAASNLQHQATDKIGAVSGKLRNRITEHTPGRGRRSETTGEPYPDDTPPHATEPRHDGQTGP